MNFESKVKSLAFFCDRDKTFRWKNPIEEEIY